MSTDAQELRRSYLIYFGGTLLIWFAMLLGSFVVLSGSPDRNTEIFTILGAAAILFLVGGAAWYITYGYDSSTTDGLGERDNQRAVERARTGLLVYFVGVSVVWLGVVIATAITLQGTSYFGKELFLVLALILLWYVVFTPMLFVRDLKRLHAGGSHPGLPAG
jgi:uncharacterized membrane protein